VNLSNLSNIFGVAEPPTPTRPLPKGDIRVPIGTTNDEVKYLYSFYKNRLNDASFIPMHSVLPPDVTLCAEPQPGSAGLRQLYHPAAIKPEKPGQPFHARERRLSGQPLGGR
jgi:hypothetical protein